MNTLEDLFNDALEVARKLKHLEGIIDAGGELTSIPDEEGALDAAERIIAFMGDKKVYTNPNYTLMPGAQDRVKDQRYLIMRRGRKDSLQMFANFDRARKQALAWSSRWALSPTSESEVYIYKLLGATCAKVPIEALAMFVNIEQKSEEGR